jgi:hypothetical protein
MSRNSIWAEDETVSGFTRKRIERSGHCSIGAHIGAALFSAN